MKNSERISKFYKTLKLLHESQLSPLQKSFREYFEDMMTQYNISSPADLKTDELKSEFWTNIGKYWKNGEGTKEGWEEKIKVNEQAINEVQLASQLLKYFGQYHRNEIDKDKLLNIVDKYTDFMFDKNKNKQKEIRNYINKNIDKCKNQSDYENIDNYIQSKVESYTNESKPARRRLNNSQIEKEKLAKESLKRNIMSETNMSRNDARLFLKNIGYTVEEIKKLER
jgi:hypothetical protein